VIETKLEDPLLAIPDDLPEGQLPEPNSRTPEQLAELAEAQERDRQRQREWAEINKALSDNAMAVTRAISRWHSREGDSERHVERVLANFRDGSFLIDRFGAAGVVDQDLAIVLLELRRRLIEGYGGGPAAMMLIDRAVAAYQDFIRVTGWTGNTAMMVEHEFFGVDRPSANIRDRHGREAREILGLSVEEHINRLGQDLIPLAERCGRVMREALAGLETLRNAPSQAVERSRPTRISIVFEGRP